MRIHGKIKHWNHQKAYGFITPDNGEKDVFVHIRAFQNRDHKPARGQLVTFSMSTDKQGRPCAAAVALPGEEPERRHRRNDRLFYLIGAVVFLAVVGLCAVLGFLPIEVLLIYLVASVLAILVYAWDKNSAQRGAWRTQESTMHLLSLLGGWPGAMVAQQLFRHKSSKKEFRFVFWLTVIINVALFIWLLTEAGRDTLQSLLSQF